MTKTKPPSWKKRSDANAAAYRRRTSDASLKLELHRGRPPKREGPRDQLVRAARLVAGQAGALGDLRRQILDLKTDVAGARDYLKERDDNIARRRNDLLETPKKDLREAPP